MDLPLVIAIHGVGNHEPEELPSLVRSTLARASMTADVAEFNWNAFGDHSIKRVCDGVTQTLRAATSA